jgi:hypothetical protein
MVVIRERNELVSTSHPRSGQRLWYVVDEGSLLITDLLSDRRKCVFHRGMNLLLTGEVVEHQNTVDLSCDGPPQKGLIGERLCMYAGERWIDVDDFTKVPGTPVALEHGPDAIEAHPAMPDPCSP